VTEEDLRSGRATDPVRGLLDFESRRARGHYLKAAHVLPREDAKRMAAAARHERHLPRSPPADRDERFDVFNAPIRVPRWRQAMIAASTWISTMAGSEEHGFRTCVEENDSVGERALKPDGLGATADVIVIGGGVAGLSAATWLADRGARVTVVEARPHLGGRASSFVDPATGETVDNGQHILMGCYRETFAFLGRIGAMSRVRLQPSLTVPSIDTAGNRSVLTCRRCPRRGTFWAASSSGMLSAGGDRLSVLRLGAPVKTERRRLRGATGPDGVFARRNRRELGSSGMARPRGCARCCGIRWRWLR